MDQTQTQMSFNTISKANIPNRSRSKFTFAIDAALKLEPDQALEVSLVIRNKFYGNHKTYTYNTRRSLEHRIRLLGLQDELKVMTRGSRLYIIRQTTGS